MEIEQHILGFTPENEAVILYVMTNARGASVRVMNIGAALVSVEVPDADGKLTDVTLGFPFYQDYLKEPTGIGKNIGRFAGRIAGGRFMLDGTEYRLPVNAMPNHMNGGAGGIANKVWQARVETNRVVFSCVSPNGEEGYPAEVGIEAVYDWDDDCQLEITYHAKSDARTVLNLACNPFFNLNGEGNGDILSHALKLKASRYLPLNASLIPTGDLALVEGTPFDFRELKPVKQNMDDSSQLAPTGDTYDHCWAVDGWTEGTFLKVAELLGDKSRIFMEVYTTQPGVSVNTGNLLGMAPRSKSGSRYGENSGIAIVCQGFPDAPNHPQFPSTVLDAGEIYEQHVIYKFSVK